MNDHDYRCKCPLCGDSLIIRLDSIDCTNCDYSRPRRQCEDMTEVRKLGEPHFVPPHTIPHPNGKQR